MKTFIGAFIISISILTGFLVLVSANTAPPYVLEPVHAAEIDNYVKDAQVQSGMKPANDQKAIAIVGSVIKAVLGVLGMVFLILMLYAGFLWMIAEGEESKVQKARGMITTAVIGLIITLSAYAIAYFVVENLQKVTGVQ